MTAQHLILISTSASLQRWGQDHTHTLSLPSQVVSHWRCSDIHHCTWNHPLQGQSKRQTNTAFPDHNWDCP